MICCCCCCFEEKGENQVSNHKLDKDNDEEMGNCQEVAASGYSSTEIC